MKRILPISIAAFGAFSTAAAFAVGNGQTTNAISFGGFPGSYSFQRATSVNYNNGNPTCPLGTVTIDGPLAPLNEEMAHVFRGPLNLMQFAVYQAPGAGSTANKKRSTDGHSHMHHHLDKKNHAHHHRGGNLEVKEVEKRGYGDDVVATINGNVVSFKDNWDAPQAPATGPAGGPDVVATVNNNVVSFANNWNPPAGAVQTVTNEAGGEPSNVVSQAVVPIAATSAFSDPGNNGAVHSEVNSGRTTYSSIITTSCLSSNVPEPTGARSSSTPIQGGGSSSSPVSAGPGSWSRVAFFDAASQTANGIAFTANNNMTVEQFGFLPGFVAANGADKASGPSMLSTTGFIPDNYEILVHTDSMCTPEDNQGGCSVVTPGAIAHHGWAGDRIILAEYKMPQSSCGSNCANSFTGMSSNTNLPAWWSLSSSTINIGQYGFSWSGDCAGWTSGAGELDIHEILPGDEPHNIGYASLHMGGHYSGTPPQGFVRPDAAASMKMALILSGDQLHIQVLDDSVDFDAALDPSTVDAWLAGNSSAPVGSSGGGHNKQVGASPAYTADIASASFDVILG